MGMVIAGVNVLGVLAAAVAGMATGAAWYGTLARPWMAAAGVSQAQVEDKTGDGLRYGTAALAQVVIAMMLAGLTGHLGEVGVRTALITAVAVWFGFVLMPMAVNHRFQMRPWSLTLIDGGYWLAVLCVQAVAIGLIGT